MNDLEGKEKQMPRNPTGQGTEYYQNFKSCLNFNPILSGMFLEYENQLYNSGLWNAKIK